ncbi:MAG: hypothetical protein ACREGI_01060 [Candidatus Levyibacteriota bacterium]
MKPQDIIFFLVVLLVILFKRSSKFVVTIGLFCLLLAIPLFAKWIFFTAERLTWYAVGFFLLAIIFFIMQKNDK